MEKEEIDENENTNKKSVCMKSVNEKCDFKAHEVQNDFFSWGRTAKSLVQNNCQLTYSPHLLFTPLTLLVWIINPVTQRRKKVRLLFDDASNITLVRQDVAEELGLIGEQVDLNFMSSGGESHKFKNQNESKFLLQDIFGKITTPVIQAGTLPAVTSKVDPLVIDIKIFDYLKDIGDYTKNHSEEDRECDEISVLLGIPYHFHYGPFGRTLGNGLHEPIAVHTQFGSIVSASKTGRQ